MKKRNYKQINFSRRDFLKFCGVNLGLATLALSSCSKFISNKKNTFSFEALEPSKLDDLSLPKGFTYSIIRSWKDPINSKEVFGTNNDYLAFFPLEKNKALLWVNHEEPDPKLIPDIEEQKKSVGGSVIAIERKNNRWQFSEDKVLQDKYNCRYDANTPVSFSGPAAKLLGNYHGTLANCSGGVTPWNTVLTCEENFIHFSEKYHWPDFKEEYYGWVVEVNPFAKKSTPVKHTALGRFAHENATIVLTKDNRLVVYMGDDTVNEHLYKYISDDPYQDGLVNPSKLLQKGSLYVAKMDDYSKSGYWQLLDISDERLSEEFSSQAELLINTRKAAKLVGATELNRPEDIEVSPLDSSVFVAQTHNLTKDDFHGSILRLREQNNDHGALIFEFDYFLEAGQQVALTCPDNLCFDDKANLWIATDIYGPDLHHGFYEFHGNNALHVVALTGKDAGKPKRFATCPNGAEITGMCFSSDYKTLFFSVQHPGELHASQWPHGSNPRSSVVAVNLY